MYEVFYKLHAEPFRLSPDHQFCYEHKGYAKAKAYLAYAFMRAEGFVMITGRPGTGKTTLIGELVETLANDDVSTAKLVCTQLQADDLLKTVAYSFGIGADNIDKAELLQRLNVLLHNWHRDGRRALLIVDEAQDLSLSAMEELRLLTNIQVNGHPLLQIFLLGQTELRDLILSPEMEQVHQRIVAASHLEALQLEETEAYVQHRLQTVGWRGDPAINRAIFPLIYKFSEGVPRRINLICSRLFLHGSVEQRHTISVQDVRVVISELQAENLAAGTRFSAKDFAVEDQDELVPVIAEQTIAEPVAVEAPARVQLHAVANQPVKPAVTNPSQNDMPVIKPIPATPSADIPVERPAADGPPDVADDQDSASAPAIQPLARGQEHANATTAGVGNGRTTTRPVKNDVQRKGPGERVILVALIALIVIFLGFFVTQEGGWSYWQRELQVLWGRMTDTGSAPAVMEAGRMPTAELDGVPYSSLVESPDTLQDDVPAADSMGLDPDGAMLYEADADEFTRALLPGDVPPADDLGAAFPEELTDQPEEWQPAGATALEDNGQVLLVEFAFDSVNLAADSLSVLDQAVGMLLNWPGSIAYITGFSDNQGDEVYKLELSRKRAYVVERYLLDGGVDRQRLYLEGYVAPSELAETEISHTEPAMQRARFVEIKINRPIEKQAYE